MAKGDITAIDAQIYETPSSSSYVCGALGINDIYLAFSAGAGSDGYVYSVTIDEDGNISAPLDSLEYQGVDNCTYSGAVQVSPGRVLVVVTHGTGGVYDGYAATISVDAAGNLAVEDTHVFASSTFYFGDLIEISSGVFAVVARYEAGTHGWLFTLTVDGSGNIATKDSVEFATDSNQYNRITHLVDEMYVIASHVGVATNANLYTIEIATDGTIDIAGTIDNEAVDFDAATGTRPEICRISDTIVAITAVTGAVLNGHIVTHSIAANGTINPTKIDSYTFTEDYTYHSKMLPSGFDDDVFVLFYNADSVAQVATFTIESDGMIIEPFIDRVTVSATTTNRMKDQFMISAGMFCGVHSATLSNDELVTHSVDDGVPENLRVPQDGIQAPVDAIPRLTIGRNGSGFSSGHQPKYTLDNDPDTWWKPDTYSTSSIYYDLGEAKTVDTVVMWIRNYNDNYDNSKSWRLSYSSDDITYTTLTEKTFVANRTTYTPIVLDKLTLVISARYWRIEFLHFASTPRTIRPEISCVWFMNEYHLPWKHQKPEENTILYHTNKTITRSGQRFTSHAGLGKQRVIKRQFIFTQESNQWENLTDAYHAARGQNLPIVMQSELASDEYYALQFSTPMSENRVEHQTWEPTLVLRELGHQRVPSRDRSLTPLNETIGLWHFRGNGNDSSGNNHHLDEVGTFIGDEYTAGYAEQGLTAYHAKTPLWLELKAADATAFDLGSTTDFSVEMWFRIESSDSVDNFCQFMSKEASGPTRGHNYVILDGPIYHAGGYDRIRYELYGDGATFTIEDSASHNPADGQWHYIVFTFDRTTPVAKVYYDGVLMDDNFDSGNLAAVGNIDAPTGPLKLILRSDEVHVDEAAFHKGKVMTLNEVSARYNASVDDYGDWGM